MHINCTHFKILLMVEIEVKITLQTFKWYILEIIFSSVFISKDTCAAKLQFPGLSRETTTRKRTRSLSLTSPS